MESDNAEARLKPGQSFTIELPFQSLSLQQQESSSQSPSGRSGTSLEELSHLVHLSKHQEKKSRNTRTRLQRSLVSAGLAARLTRCSESANRNLAECFRGDDKKTFAGLYNAIVDVRDSCNELRRFALLEEDEDAAQSLTAAAASSAETLEMQSDVGVTSVPGSQSRNFLWELTSAARDTVIGFLTQIRTNPDFLASRLCSLRSTELSALVTSSSTLRPSGQGRARNLSGHAVQGGLLNERNAVDRLLSFQRRDPLAALLHTCFAVSAGPDSADAKRQLDVWTTACARLISLQKSAAESILVCVLNAWTAAQEWPGKLNVERYLMRMLEDGAFLLDRAEDQHGTRFNISDWTAEDQREADSFYERATRELFDIIDDEDSTGIPEGLFEFANQVLNKLDRKFVESMRRWFVSKWLFSTFLLDVVVHPESHGIMAEYHITEYGRQKILKAVATRAQEHVLNLTWKAKPGATPKPADPQINTHVENILGRFQREPRKATPRLVSARSTTSLRETAEVRPYLLICPADLATVINTLYPESQSSTLSGFTTVRTEQSVDNLPSDTASVLSIGSESVSSDLTTPSADFLQDQMTGSSHRQSPPIEASQQTHQATDYDGDSYKLRLALHELNRTFGHDVVLGASHPCAEPWAVLFISPKDGTLAAQLNFEQEGNIYEDEDSSTNASSDEDDGEGSELHTDYHELRDAVLRFVQDYEIPQSFEGDSGRQESFSNRASKLKKYRRRDHVIEAESSVGRTYSEGATSATPLLLSMLESAFRQARAQNDFVTAHRHWKTIQQLQTLESNSLRRNGFAGLLDIFSRGPRETIRHSAFAIEEYDAWLVWLKQSQERTDTQVELMMRRLRALRDKMWYTVDVRNSGPYEATRNIAVALKTMGMPRRWERFKRLQAQAIRGPAAGYIMRPEAQMVEIISAAEEYGGPNKLADDQAEKTMRWLRQQSVVNFCRGEERIHMFSHTIKDLIDKLVGETMNETPVLWSSDLYQRDRLALGGSRIRDPQRWDDGASISSDPERRYSASDRATDALRELRGMSNFSPQPRLDGGRVTGSRASAVLSDGFDAREYFSASSSVHSVDTVATFWSPFDAARPSSRWASSMTYSPTTSVSNLTLSGLGISHHAKAQTSDGRPGTSASTSSMMFRQRLSDEKHRFLMGLRRTLTSLLLSDLGTLVFARGAEADEWFATIGQQCIDRAGTKDEEYQTITERQVPTARSGARERGLKKKGSVGDLRSAGSEQLRSSAELGFTNQGGEHVTARAPDTSESSDVNDNLSPTSPINRRVQLSDFPFANAYERLLRIFCVNPSPYGKLTALIELEQLILASRSSWSRRFKRSSRPRSPDLDEKSKGRSPPRGPRPLQETIATIKARRSHAAVQSPTVGSPSSNSFAERETDSRSVKSARKAADTDAVVKILTDLFRSADIRPKALFRDLQFVATFVSPAALDSSRAFWNVALAALILKQEVCMTMVRLADEIVESNTKRKSKRTSAPPPARSRSRPSQAIPATASAPMARQASAGNEAIPSSVSAVPLSITTRAPATAAVSLAEAEAQWSNTTTGRSQSQAVPDPAISIPLQVATSALLKPSADSTAASSSPPKSPPASYTLADAAKMYTITAKEGDPAAQRELGLFLITYPEYVDRVTMPLSRPRDVFRYASTGQTKSTASGSTSGGRAGGRSGVGAGGSSMLAGNSLPPGGAGASGPGAAGKHDVRNDPVLLSIAMHWMKEAANTGGDQLARNFLAQNEGAAFG
jgi:hypothetical protein